MFNCMYFPQDDSFAVISQQDCKSFNKNTNTAKVFWKSLGQYFEGEIWFSGNKADSEAKMAKYIEKQKREVTTDEVTDSSSSKRKRGKSMCNLLFFIINLLFMLSK